MSLDEATKRRLIYIKRLYMHGHEHIPYGTELDRMIAIHHFDNAVELLLKCVATKHNIAFKTLHVTFPNLWNQVNQRYELPKKTEMFQLHDFRSDVQHWGISPFSSEIVNRFDVYTLDFIQTVFRDVFSLELDELFMASLVNNERIRNMLMEAEKAFGNGDYKNSMKFTSAAFAYAKLEERRKLDLFNPFFSLHSLTFTKVREFDEIRRALMEIAEEILILALRIDYRNYSRFDKIAPRARFAIGKEEPIVHETKEENYTRENALFCFNFVLGCLLRWHT